MLEWLVVARGQIGDFLDRLGHTLHFKSCHVLLAWFKLIKWTVDDDLLADVVRGS